MVFTSRGRERVAGLDDLHFVATATGSTELGSSSPPIIVDLTYFNHGLFASVNLGSSLATAGGSLSVTTHLSYSRTLTLVGPVPLTLSAAPWSIATAAVDPGGGVLQLVTPLRISRNLTGGGVAHPFSGVLHLDLVFVPEPSTGLLVGFGSIAMAWQGRRKSRRAKR